MQCTGFFLFWNTGLVALKLCGIFPDQGLFHALAVRFLTTGLSGKSLQMAFKLMGELVGTLPHSAPLHNLSLSLASLDIYCVSTKISTSLKVVNLLKQKKNSHRNLSQEESKALKNLCSGCFHSTVRCYCLMNSLFSTGPVVIYSPSSVPSLIGEKYKEKKKRVVREIMKTK